MNDTPQTVADVVRQYLDYAIHFLGKRTYYERRKTLQTLSDSLGAKPVAECRRSDLELFFAARSAWKSDSTKRVLMNHTSASTTERYYIHLETQNKHLKEAMARAAGNGHAK